MLTRIQGSKIPTVEFLGILLVDQHIQLHRFRAQIAHLALTNSANFCNYIPEAMRSVVSTLKATGIEVRRARPCADPSRRRLRPLLRVGPPRGLFL